MQCMIKDISSYILNVNDSYFSEGEGYISTSGKRWSSQRNFTVKHLKNFGFGKKDLEVGMQSNKDGHRWSQIKVN